MAKQYTTLAELLADPELRPAIRELALAHLQMAREIWDRRQAEAAAQAEDAATAEPLSA